MEKSKALCALLRRHSGQCLRDGRLMLALAAVAALVCLRWGKPWFSLCLALWAGQLLTCLLLEQQRLRREQQRLNALLEEAAPASPVSPAPHV